jgi:hypothetical protein
MILNAVSLPPLSSIEYGNSLANIKPELNLTAISLSLSASPSDPLCELPQIEKHCFKLLPPNEVYGALHGGVLTFQMTQHICQLVSGQSGV